jgi:hypothetical protein
MVDNTKHYRKNRTIYNKPLADMLSLDTFHSSIRKSVGKTVMVCGKRKGWHDPSIAYNVINKITTCQDLLKMETSVIISSHEEILRHYITIGDTDNFIMLVSCKKLSLASELLESLFYMCCRYNQKNISNYLIQMKELCNESTVEHEHGVKFKVNFDIAFMDSFVAGHLEFVKWTITGLSLQPSDEFLQHALRASYAHENYDVFDWFLTFQPKTAKNMASVITIVYDTSNHINWEWMYKFINITDDNSDFFVGTNLSTCITRIGILKIFWSKFYEGIRKSPYFIEKLLLHACASHDKDLIGWLLDAIDMDLDWNMHNSILFRTLCLKEYTDLLSRLDKKVKIDYSAYFHASLSSKVIGDNVRIWLLNNVPETFLSRMVTFYVDRDEFSKLSEACDSRPIIMDMIIVSVVRNSNDGALESVFSNNEFTRMICSYLDRAENKVVDMLVNCVISVFCEHIEEQVPNSWIVEFVNTKTSHTICASYSSIKTIRSIFHNGIRSRARGMSLSYE